ncbi:MAG: hypothetical protein AAFX95_06670 [Cyanobacteria bacterium J06639_16]
MILEERRVHFYAFSGLAVVLPIVFITGLVLRPNYDAVSNEATTDLFAQAGFATGDAGEAIASDTLSLKGITLTAESTRSSEGAVILTLQPQRDPEVADLLVYWMAGEGEPETIDADVVLLGQLAGTARRQFELPAGIQGQAGQLVFYSQGQQQVIGTAPLSAEMTQ